MFKKKLQILRNIKLIKRHEKIRKHNWFTQKFFINESNIICDVKKRVIIPDKIAKK